MSNMINDNEDPTEMEYELEGTTAFEVGTTSDPNPSKKEKKSKTTKARGPTFSRFGTTKKKLIHRILAVAQGKMRRCYYLVVVRVSKMVYCYPFSSSVF